jgi:hypothetical protein
MKFMSQLFLWLGGILSVIYGSLTVFTGYGQTKASKIQVWAAWSFILCGLFIVVAGIMALFEAGSAIWLLVLGLLGIHVLAINNGLKMFGKINPSHHLARLVISVVLFTLTYLGLK